MHLPTNIPPAVRSTYARELVSWSLSAVALGVLEGGVLGQGIRALIVPIALSTLGALGFASWALEGNEENPSLELARASTRKLPTRGTQRWLVADSDRRF